MPPVKASRRRQGRGSATRPRPSLATPRAPHIGVCVVRRFVTGCRLDRELASPDTPSVIVEASVTSAMQFAGRLSMGAVVRCGTLLAFLVFSVACGNADGPTAPSSTPSTPTPPPTPPPPPAGQPPLSGPATTFLFFSGPLAIPVSPETTNSRYVLYDNGAFSFKYLSFAGEYTGSYRQEDGRIFFDFEANSSWDASSTLNDNLLEIRYSDRMQHSDFENAVYRRSQ